MQKQASEFVLDSLLEYGEYFNEHRAIPSLVDGMKPSQRKILFGAALLKLASQGKYKKATNLVGAVVPFYQHGSSALEGAITRMGQEFKMTYPVLDIQGNTGGQSLLESPNSGAAATRYLDLRLTRIGEDLLQSIPNGTAKMMPTYDGTMEEPEHLFIPIPAFLLFNQKGIGVGTATSIPSFQIDSVIEAAARLIKHPETTYEQLAHILKPYYVQQAKIINKSELPEIYSHKPRDKKKGSIKFRANFNRSGNKLIITNLPYDGCPSAIAKQIETKFDEVESFKYIKRIQDTTGLDSKGREVVSMEIDIQSRADEAKLIADLCHHTNLESYISMNLVLLDFHGKVKEYNVKEALLEWIEIYKIKALDKLRADLAAVEAKLEKVMGLLKALDEIDEIIELIKASISRAAAKDKLVGRGYTEVQANAILDMRLSKLANMEHKSLMKERDDLLELSSSINTTINDTGHFQAHLISTMGEYKTGEKLFCPQEDSQREKVKEVKEEKVYLVQVRDNVKVHDTVPGTKDYVVADKSNPAYVLYENRVGVVKNANTPLFQNAFCILEGSNDVVHVNAEGKVKRTKIEDLRTARDAIATRQKQVVFAGQVEDQYVVLTSNKGHKLQFHIDNVPYSGRGAVGVIGAKLGRGEKIVNVELVDKVIKGVPTGRNKKMG